jgi:YVTN family beta-propeller protein
MNKDKLNSVVLTLTAILLLFTIISSTESIAAAQSAYITCDDGNVYIINTETQQVIPLHVGNDPYGITVTPDGSKVYVTDFKANNVYGIGIASNTVSSPIKVGSTPVGVAVTPDGKKLYVANSADNSVSVIDTATNTVTKKITGLTKPYGVAISPDGSKAYVTNVASTSV